MKTAHMQSTGRVTGGHALTAALAPAPVGQEEVGR
jgi:hypothetical protein